MIAFDLGLISFTDRYLLARSVSGDYANSLRSRIANFCAWAGSDVPIHALTCELANEWLSELADSGMSAWSLAGYRGALLAVWNDAFQSGANQNPPLRIKRIAKPRMIVECYTHSEIRLLLSRAAQLKTIHRDKNRAADFWNAAIHVGYCCGPRRGDLLSVEWRHVSPQGVLSFVQHKTGFPNSAQLSKQAIASCRRLQGDGKLLPYPYYPDWFSRSFTALRKSAGVTRGSFKWLRRSAGSYVESKQKGAGARLLGHQDESVFRRFYEDVSITNAAPVAPPPL